MPNPKIATPKTPLPPPNPGFGVVFALALIQTASLIQGKITFKARPPNRNPGHNLGLKNLKQFFSTMMDANGNQSPSSGSSSPTRSSTGTAFSDIDNNPSPKTPILNSAHVTTIQIPSSRSLENTRVELVKIRSPKLRNLKKSPLTQRCIPNPYVFPYSSKIFPSRN